MFAAPPRPGSDLRARPYDHPDVVALTALAQAYYVRVYGGPDTDPLEPGDLAPPRGGFLVGYRDAAPVAMGGWTFAGEPGPPVAHLRRMFVRDSARRQGWAAALLRGLEADAVRQGASSVILATGSPQVEAVAFYRAQGYADIPAFGYYATSATVVCLGKDLAGAETGPEQP